MEQIPQLENFAEFGEAAGLTPLQIEQMRGIEEDMAAIATIMQKPGIPEDLRNKGFSTAFLVAGEQ